MLEVEATPASEAAATPTGEASLAEAGGGPGAAGRQRSPKLSATILRYQMQQRIILSNSAPHNFICRRCTFFVILV